MAKKFYGKYKLEGFDFGNSRDSMLRHCSFNIGKRFVLQDIEVESKKQRGFFEGAVLPLWAYLDGNDYTDSSIVANYHEYAKQEFNPAYIIISGKSQKVGGSTKGKLNGEHGIINKVIDFLEEQYGIDRMEVLDPNGYKEWRDIIFSHNGPETYIEYLVSIKKLSTPTVD